MVFILFGVLLVDFVCVGCAFGLWFGLGVLVGWWVCLLWVWVVVTVCLRFVLVF